ncbi:hypothetical protein Tco_0012249 [Tanacetum coccineum]
MDEINNFQQEPDEILFRAWEKIQRTTDEVSSTLPNRHAGAIQEMAEYSKKWHNGASSRTRGTKTSDGLAAIQAQLNNLGREIKKVNEKFGAPYQPGGQYKAAGLGFYQRNNRNSSYPARRETMEESLAKFMTESAKRHEENSNIIKEIRAFTDAAIQNQGASIKTLELQIRQMSKVLQERGFGSLPSSTESNLQDQVKSISTATADLSEIRHHPYAPLFDLELVGECYAFSPYTNLGSRLAKAQIARTSSNFYTGPCLIMESLVKKKQKGAILELKRRHLKKVLKLHQYAVSRRKIRRIRASSSQERVLINSRSGVSTTSLYAVCTAVHQSKIRIKCD